MLFGSGTLEDYPQFENPAGIHSAVLDWLFLPGFALFCAALIGAVGVRRAALPARRGHRAAAVDGARGRGRGGDGDVRHQRLRSVPGRSEDLGIAITLLGVLAIPVGVGVAMLRYRLYDIDRVISRTLVYGALTVILGAAYVALVLAGQALFSSFAGGSNLAIAVSTLVVAALFLPLRSRVQRVVDRRFYRRRYDAQRTLDGVRGAAARAVELDRLRTRPAGRRPRRRCSRRTCRCGSGRGAS